jgi:hypothetical protein
MSIMPRRSVLASAGVAAGFASALGLSKRLEFVGLAHAETPLEPTVGFYKYRVGVTAVYDGIWRKQHDPTFIKNASVEDTEDALAKAGLTTDFMPILTPVILTVSKEHHREKNASIQSGLFDAGCGS